MNDRFPRSTYKVSHQSFFCGVGDAATFMVIKKEEATKPHNLLVKFNFFTYSDAQGIAIYDCLYGKTAYSG
jgi:hypothetical protein